MLQIRKSSDRGHVQHGWLDTYHTFSFDQYYDPAHVRFRSLRVINEDRIEAGQGFGMHPHRDMEILTYVLSGSLEHKDSMGNGSIIKVGDIQYMSAGSGVLHSEFNPSASEATHLFQIWIFPDEHGYEPRYGQVNIPIEERANTLWLLAGPTQASAPITIRQDAKLYSSILHPKSQLSYTYAPDRAGYLQLASGRLEVNGLEIHPGDGLEITNEEVITITAIGKTESEFLLFDLA